MASDISLIWATDFIISPTGGIQAVSGPDLVIQRVIRRFLTNAQVLDTLGRVVLIPDYLFHPTYGGNARQQVDALASTALIQRLQQNFAAQAYQEEGVAQNPPPIVNITKITDGLQMDVTIVLTNGTSVSAQGVRIA